MNTKNHSKAILFILFIAGIGLITFLIEAALFGISAQKKTISFAAGRSGGHIVPARTIAAHYKTSDIRTKTLFFSTKTKLDLDLLQNRPEIDTHIPYKLENIPHNSYLQRIWYLGRVLMTTAQSYVQLIHHKTLELHTTGGYIALPTSIAAWFAGIPITLYELNAIPGKAAYLVHLIAHKTKCSFKKAQTHFLLPKKTEYAPYPIRFLTQHKCSKSLARKKLEITPDTKVIAIFGGSQGSHFFNTAIPPAIAQLKKQKLFVIQQTGADDVAEVKAAYKHYKIPALIFSFRSDINHIYSAADLCITRAGAGSIFELLFFEVPSIIIPLETAINDHQLDNARAFVNEQSKLFSLLRQNDVKTNKNLLIQEIENKLQKNTI